ncbi:MAG: hypothetical protein ACR2MY_05090 [Candidatus Dormibacteria bacterium]
MEERFTEFKDRHALLLTEIRRLSDEAADETLQSRNRELRSILKVVARSYLRENVDPQVPEELLQDWLVRLEAA